MEDLNMVAEINFEEEQNRAAASFEALVFRAVVAVDEDDEFEKYRHLGKLRKLGIVRYVLAKDLAMIANTMMDTENYSTDSTQKKKEDAVTSQTVSGYCRDLFRLPVERSGSKGGGNAVVLDKEMISAIKFRFGMDQVELEDASTALSVKQLEMKT